MTRKERVINTVKRKPADYPPYHIDFTGILREKTAERLGMNLDLIDNAIGDHFIHFDFLPPNTFKSEFISETRWKDEFGIIWDTTNYQYGDWNIVHYPLQSKSDLVNYKWPDPHNTEGRFKHMYDRLRVNNTRFVMFKTSDIFHMALQLCSFEELLVKMATEPSFIHELFERLLEFLVGIVEELPPEVDGCKFLADIGTQKGLCISLDMWREFVKPRSKVLYEACKKRGFIVEKHSCGDNMDLLPDLIELGVDIYDPVQPEVQDITEMKRKYGKDITLLGGLGAQSTIPNGTPEEVKAEVFRTYDILGKDGGYIISPAGSMPAETPVENVLALIEACQTLCPEYTE
jgi:uroporphyrinogen decarboxylase